MRSPATIGVMPNKPKTTLRNVRVDDELWQAAQAAAEARGETVSEAIRAFLKRYAKSAVSDRVAKYQDQIPTPRDKH